VIVRTRITPDLSFAAAPAGVRQSVLHAHARQELPFDLLILADRGLKGLCSHQANTGSPAKAVND
jgi:hypothetical protein